MAREYVWFTAIDGVLASTDHTLSLYSGLGTIDRIVGQVTGASTSTSTRAMVLYNWTINVGPAAADPIVRGQDPPGMMIRGSGFVPNRAVADFYVDPGPTEVSTEGRRVMQAGDQLWLRFRALTGGISWEWYWDLRVLVLLPEA
jgi:hypothetical protein